MQLLPFLGLALITSVCARTISINFWDNSASSADNNQVDPGETAGVIPVDGTHWNQIGFSHLNTSANLVGPLTDDAGNPSAATLDFVLSSASVNFTGAVNGGAPKSGDRDMMASYISWDPDAGDVGDLEIKSLSSDFTTPGYDLYVYFETSDNNRSHTITVNGTSQTGTDASTWSGLFHDATLQPADSNLMVFRGLTASDLTLEMDAATNRGGITGLQIVSLDHPATDRIHVAMHNGTTTAAAMADGENPTSQGNIVDTSNSHWNNAINGGGSGLNFTGLPLTTARGAASGATLAVNSGYSGFTTNGWENANKDWVMMEGWYGFKQSEAFTVSNLPPSITNGGYHVVIYGDSNSSSRTMNYTIDDGTGAQTATILDSSVFSGTFVEERNFVVISGLSGTSFTLTGNPGSGDSRSAINGLVVVAGDPPNPPVITDFSADDHYVAPGSTVTLSWDAPSFDTLTLDPGNIDAAALTSAGIGNLQLTLIETTEYTLHATLGEEATSRTIRVGVGPERPNIIFFLVDDMGWQDTSVPFYYDSSGNAVVTPLNQRYRTPGMEDLAARGMKFTNAYAMPVCTPSRNCWITGINSARHHVTNWTNPAGTETSQNSTPSHRSPTDWIRSGLPDTHTTLPSLLQQAGYRTIHAGKAHFGATDYAKDPLNVGFDVNIAGSEIGHPGSYLGDYGQGGSRPVPGLEDYHNTGTFLTEALTLEINEAINESIDDGAPFFAYMAHYAVHSPFTEDTRFSANYPTLSGGELNYATMIEGMDKSLADMMANLSPEVAKNTLIIFTSDNGGDAPTANVNDSNAPLRHKKGSKYEGGIREPLLIAWATPDPGNPFQTALPIPAASREDDIVAIFDLFPTMAEVAGISHGQDIDGHDLTPYLRGQPGEHRPQELLIHFPHDHRSDYFTILREGDWKLIYNYASNSYELYNLANDISEATDLASSEPDQVMAMARRMARALHDAGAQWPTFSSGGADDPYAMPALPGVDLDLDGLPDNDEDPNGNGLIDTGETDPDRDDSDGDRTLDGDELRTGTDPLNPTSFFKATPSGVDGKLIITWPSKPGALYHIESSTTLTADSWSTVVDDHPAEAVGSSTSLDVGALGGSDRMFFRVSLK